MLHFRPATLGDGPLLLAWRNDPLTRAMSHNSDPVEYDAHMLWVARSIASDDRVLQIVERDGVPVGTVRADRTDHGWELSWTVAPEARGQGVAKAMVAAFAQSLEGVLRAEVKVGNGASERVAEGAGFRLRSEVDGVLHYVMSRHPAG